MRQRDQLTLIIGYGNSLRRDDGIGLKVASEVEKLGLPGTRSRQEQQLTPELAATIAEFDRVIFVDAAINSERVQLQQIQSQQATGTQLGHNCDARSLLAMTELLYGNVPQAWLITIPAANFEFGEGFSPTAEQGAKKALQIIANLVGSNRDQLS